MRVYGARLPFFFARPGLAWRVAPEHNLGLPNIGSSLRCSQGAEKARWLVCCSILEEM
jgi:hypothetical protein